MDQLDEAEAPDKDAVHLIDNASEEIPPLRRTTRTRRRPDFYSNYLNVIQEKSWKERAVYLYNLVNNNQLAVMPEPILTAFLKIVSPG